MTTQLLPKLGMARTHPLRLRYAPTNRGGLDLPNYYVIQGTTSIKQAIQHLRLQTELGKHMLYHLRWTQTLTGLQVGILTDVTTDLNYVSHTWWMNVRSFLQYIQGTMQLENSYTVHPLRQNDYSIMERIVT